MKNSTKFDKSKSSHSLKNIANKLTKDIISLIGGGSSVKEDTPDAKKILEKLNRRDDDNNVNEDLINRIQQFLVNNAEEISKIKLNLLMMHANDLMNLQSPTILNYQEKGIFIKNLYDNFIKNKGGLYEYDTEIFDDYDKGMDKYYTKNLLLIIVRNLYLILCNNKTQKELNLVFSKFNKYQFNYDYNIVRNFMNGKKIVLSVQPSLPILSKSPGLSPTLSNLSPTLSNLSPTLSKKPGLSPTLPDPSPTLSNLSPTLSNLSPKLPNLSPKLPDPSPKLSVPLKNRKGLIISRLEDILVKRKDILIQYVKFKQFEENSLFVWDENNKNLILKPPSDDEEYGEEVKKALQDYNDIIDKVYNDLFNEIKIITNKYLLTKLENNKTNITINYNEINKAEEDKIKIIETDLKFLDEQFKNIDANLNKMKEEHKKLIGLIKPPTITSLSPSSTIGNDNEIEEEEEEKEEEKEEELDDALKNIEQDEEKEEELDDALKNIEQDEEKEGTLVKKYDRVPIEVPPKNIGIINKLKIKRLRKRTIPDILKDLYDLLNKLIKTIPDGHDKENSVNRFIHIYNNIFIRNYKIYIEEETKATNELKKKEKELIALQKKGNKIYLEEMLAELETEHKQVNDNILEYIAEIRKAEKIGSPTVDLNLNLDQDKEEKRKIYRKIRGINYALEKTKEDKNYKDSRYIKAESNLEIKIQEEKDKLSAIKTKLENLFVRIEEYEKKIDAELTKLNINPRVKGGKLAKYKSTGNKVYILYKKKKYIKTIYVKENTITKYCKINDKYYLLSKLKIIEDT